MTSRTTGTLAALLTFASAPAQQAGPTLDLGVVPIHTHGEKYGIRAGAADYEVSFHDGFVFQAYGGDAQERPGPWRWRTRSLRIGAEELIGEEERPQLSWTDSRLEYRYDRFVEVYDVRVDGVEQSFVIDERPATSGDLVVRGAVETELPVVSEPDLQHGELVFARGDERISYGAAFAIDANGQQLAIARSWVGGEIELRVPGEWLQGAAFPLTVDPIVAGPVWRSGAADRWLYEIEPYSEHRALVVLVRDGDAFVFLCRPDLSDPRLVHVDMSDISTVVHDAAFVDAPRRWVVALSKPGPAYYERTLDYLVLDAGDARWGAGTVLSSTESYSPASFLPPPLDIGLGGTAPGAAGDDALVVRATPGMAGARRLDLRSLTWATSSSSLLAFPARSSTWIHDVTPSRGPTSPWMVTLSDTLLTSDSLYAAPVWPDGRASTVLVSGGTWSTTAAETSDGTWVVNGWSPGTGTRFWKLTWTGGDLAVAEIEHTLDTETKHFGLAWDPVAQQLCTSTRQRGTELGEALRLSRRLCVIERQPIRPLPYGTHYDPTDRAFVVPTYSRDYGYMRTFHLPHDTRVGTHHYGTGCLGAITATTPYATSDVTFRLTDAPPGLSTLLVLSPVRTSSWIGDGCYVLVDTTTAIAIERPRTSAAGTASAEIPLPDCPAFIGQLYAQWILETPAGLRSTKGLVLAVLP